SLRVISGDTTVTEVLDAVGPAFWPELAQHYGSEYRGEALEENAQHVAPGQAVLLIGSDPGIAGWLEPLLAAEGLSLLVAPDAESAGKLLRTNEDIAFIIGDLPDEDTLEQCIERLRENRLHISWARLPSLVLLPQALSAHHQALRDSGVMAEIMGKPLEVTQLLGHIWHARAR
ncbi:MAG: hypothetical protein ACKO4A_10920, partial [Gammaproteobacteria bacterium]